MSNSIMQYMNSARRNVLEAPSNDTTNQSWAAPPSTMLEINVDGSTRQDNAYMTAVLETPKAK